MNVYQIIQFLNNYLSNQDITCILGVMSNLLLCCVAIKITQHRGIEKRKQIVFRYESLAYESIKIIAITLFKILFAFTLSAIFSAAFLFVKTVYSIPITIAHPMIYTYTVLICLFFMIVSLFLVNEEREETFAKQRSIKGILYFYCFLLYLCSALYVVCEKNRLLAIILVISPLFLLFCILAFIGQPRFDYIYKSVKIYFIDREEPIICGIKNYQNERNCIRITDVFSGMVTEYEKCGLVRVEFYTSDLDTEEKAAS